MPKPSRWSDIPRQGVTSFELGTGPFWQGTDKRVAGWFQPGAVWAADFSGGRYACAGLAVTAEDILSTVRSSAHLLADASGTIRSFAANTLARADGIGAWIGGPATNNDSRSQEFENAAWSRDNTSVSANAALAPDGMLTADKLIGSATTSAHSIYKPANSYTSGQTYVESVYARAAEHEWVQLTTTSSLGSDKWANFHLTGAGAIGNRGAGCTPFIVPLANGWYRCGFLFTAAATVSGGKSIVLTNNTDAASRGPSYLADGVSGVHLWQAGSIASKFAVPPIPTASGTATRPASDVRAASLGWFNAAGLAPGASELVVPKWSHTGDGANRTLFEFSDGTQNNLIKGYVNGSDAPALKIIAGGVTQTNTALAAPIGVGRKPLAFGWGATGGYVADAVGNSATFGAITLPAGLTQKRLGGAVAGDYLNDILEQMQTCYPLSLAAAQAWAAA